MAIYKKGIVLTQHKEPAFSRPIVRFTNPKTDSLILEREHIVDVGSLDQDDIIDIAREAQIVDERDGKPLFRKLQRAKSRAVAVVADAIDDEPYVSSQINPIMKLREEAAGGLALCAKVAECDCVLILAYKNITDLETHIPNTIESYRVIKIRGGYPAESRIARVKIPPGRKLIVGAGALIHLYRAVYENMRQTTVFITVAGNCVANPMNLEVSIGMTVAQVLERCGLVADPTRVVCGGSMTGISIISTEKTLITYTTRAVLAFLENEHDAHYSCIGCGRCEQVCPVGLNPMYIYRLVQSHYYANLALFDAHMCSGCGTCSYVCPSRLGVASAVASAKQYALEHFITGGEEAEDNEA